MESNEQNLTSDLSLPRYELAALGAGYLSWEQWMENLPEEANEAMTLFGPKPDEPVEGEVVDDKKE